MKMNIKSKLKKKGFTPSEMRSVSVLRENREVSGNRRTATHRNLSAFHTGFTLIELLVVIAIISILMVTVVITLNPGELMKQARDSNRLSDMATLKTAISLYEADVATSSALATANTCYAYVPSGGAVISCTNTSNTGEFKNSPVNTISSSSRTVDGTGWIPVDFNLISSGAPISQLPIDPLSGSTSSTFYGFEASGTALFKLTMKTESVKFSASGTADVESTDGGSFSGTYEAGPGVSSL